MVPAADPPRGKEASLTHYVITLVHGTFAPNAEWTSANSRLRRILAEKLEEVTFETFKWSGANSHKARVDGAKLLQDYLAKSLAASPDATHVVVAHSHGGNIALRAIAGTNLETKIALVCMATPFLTAIPRNFEPFGHNEIRRGFSFAIGALFFVAAAVMLFLLSPYLGWMKKLLWLPFCLALGASATAERRYFRYVDAIVLNLQPIATKKMKLFVVRTCGDEASGGMITAYFGAWLTNAVWMLLQRSARKLNIKTEGLEQFWKSSIVIFALMLLFLFLGDHNVSNAKTIFLSTGMALGIGLGIYGFMLVSRGVLFFGAQVFLLGIYYLVALIVFSLYVIPFGIELASASLLAELFIEAVPPGGWPVYMDLPYSRSVNQESDSIFPQLAHSKSYSQDGTLETIATWIRYLPSGENDTAASATHV